MDEGRTSKERAAGASPKVKALVAAGGVAGLVLFGWVVWRAMMPEVRGGAGVGGGPLLPGRAGMVDQETLAARKRALAEIPDSPGMPAAHGGVPSSPTSVARQTGNPPAAIAVPGVAPVTIGGSSLKIGSHEAADPLEFALHPSHFADMQMMTRKLTVGPISLDTQPAKEGPPSPSLYEKAVALEKSRSFVMSMCTDLEGRLWVGCEAGAPGDGVTGGVQCFDPSKPPLEAWTEYTTKDGLGDNNGYAIACDKKGRIWVGHLNHGVSVFNGQKWRNYEVVAGLSRPDSLAGPLGERIFKIAVNPKDGDVWMASSLGLARYSDSKDTWSYYTRAEGLPSDQANALAFDKEGTIYVGTQCDGIAIASPQDNYKTWRQGDGAGGDAHECERERVADEFDQ
ncbi:MAG TPA: hypothetical protein VH253_08180 [Phycisphaerae bacterium]|nr:hypothetical protein [Phycisphaerae bacterium]